MKQTVKTLLAVLIVISGTTAVCAHASGNWTTIEPPYVEDYESEPEELEIVTKPDQNPEFPGGLQGLMQFLGSNLIYPAEAYKNKVEGRVLVKFVVTKAGKVENIGIERSVSPELDAEAIRVVSLLPEFTPGKVNGEPVNVWFVLPITFILSN